MENKGNQEYVFIPFHVEESQLKHQDVLCQVIGNHSDYPKGWIKKINGPPAFMWQPVRLLRVDSSVIAGVEFHILSDNEIHRVAYSTKEWALTMEGLKIKTEHYNVICASSIFKAGIHMLNDIDEIWAAIDKYNSTLSWAEPNKKQFKQFNKDLFNKYLDKFSDKDTLSILSCVIDRIQFKGPNKEIIRQQGLSQHSDVLPEIPACALTQMYRKLGLVYTINHEY